MFGVEAALRRKVEQSIGELAELGDGATVNIGGVVTALTRKFTKKGDQMAVFVLEDLEANIEVTLFPRTLQEHGHKLGGAAVNGFYSACTINYPYADDHSEKVRTWFSTSSSGCNKSRVARWSWSRTIRPSRNVLRELCT